MNIDEKNPNIDITIDFSQALFLILDLTDSKIKVYERNVISEKERLVSIFSLDENGELQHFEENNLNKSKQQEDISAFYDLINAIYLSQQESDKFRIETKKRFEHIELCEFLRDVVVDLDIMCRKNGNNMKIEIDEVLKHIEEKYMKNEKYSDIVEKLRKRIEELRIVAHNIEGYYS